MAERGRRGVGPADHRAVRAGDARQRDRSRGLPPGRLVPPDVRRARPAAGAPADPPLQRRRLRGPGLGERRAGRPARGRLHPFLGGRDRPADGRRRADRRRLCQGRPPRPRQAARQAGLAPRGPFHLVPAHQRHLAVRLDRVRPAHPRRQPPLDPGRAQVGDRAPGPHRRPDPPRRPPTRPPHRPRRHARRRHVRPPPLDPAGGDRLRHAEILPERPGHRRRPRVPPLVAAPPDPHRRRGHARRRIGPGPRRRPRLHRPPHRLDAGRAVRPQRLALPAGDAPRPGVLARHRPHRPRRRGPAA